MKEINKTAFIFLLSLTPSIVMATVSDEVKRFYKCYSLFVGERVKTSDALWQAVESGKKSGTDACMEIFDSATLTSNGEISKGMSNDVGVKVLNTFTRFQKSQFMIPDYGPVIGTSSDRYTRDVTDSNEAAYQFVYTMFNPKEKFSNVVTRDFSIKAIRYSKYPVRTLSVLNNKELIGYAQGTYKSIPTASGGSKIVPDNLTEFHPVLAETGILIGLKRVNFVNDITNTAVFEKLNYGFNDPNVSQHIGGGVMGTQAYLFANLGRSGFGDGGATIFRRWGKNVMDDFLCRELPTLRTTDVIKEVNTASTIAFKTGISCMACHASMDNLSGVLRNGRISYSSTEGIEFKKVKYFGVRTPTLAYADMPVLKADKDFYRRPPHGRLFYRSYDETLVKKEMVGPQALGEVMAETNDLYVCAAKRYYRFLTGITVDLADIGNINTPVFTKGAKYQREKVIQLGLQLKKHQSGRELIKSIISQEAFIRPQDGV